MAINLSKNRDTLLSAWKEVVDDKCKTNWALFGYEGQTNDLKVVSKGEGGIEEMTDDLNSGKIMYAFCKVIDPKTSLPKCVLINWQGEGAPLVRKGTCANHVRDVARFFIGAHVTINARTEEEVDPDIIMDKVSKSTGSAYSFKDRDTMDVSQDCGPVGTTYKRVIPTQEINSRERDKFWEKEEMEEKQRQAEERKRRDEERRKMEEERQQREVAEALQREEKIKERSRTIVQLREAEKNADNRPQQDSIAREWEKDIEETERDERERKARSEILRRQRSQEAQAVISKRTIDARAIFEQNTSAGQMQSRVMPGRLQSIPNSNTQRLPSLASSSSFDLTSNVTADQPSSIPVNQQRKASLPTWPPTTVSAEEISPKFIGKRQWPPLIEGEASGSSSEANSVGQNVSETNVSVAKREAANAEEAEEEQDWETPPLEAGPEIRDPVGALLREQGQGTPAVIPGESPYHQLATQDSSTVLPEAPSAVSVQPQIQNVSQDLVDARPTTEGQEADATQFSNGMLDDAVANADYGLTARALYDYQAADATEISFDPNDIITNIDQIDEGWWQGVGPDGSFGLFPANYVELLN